LNKNLKYFAFIICGLFLFEICNKESSNPKSSSQKNTPLVVQPDNSNSFTEPKKISDDNISSNPILTPRPKNGFSPYNSYFGNGVYDNSTENSIVVTAPEEADMVIFIRDIYSGKTIRNEYIRANTIFSLTGLPYGNYKFIYLYGSKWNSDLDFKNGAAKGNFSSNKGVGKSKDYIDFEFKTGYKGTYTLKLQLIVNGNLETIPASEDEI